MERKDQLMDVRWIALLALAGCMDTDDSSTIEVTARFFAAPISGMAPLVVQFTDESIGDVGGWEWDFGDGKLSFLPSPTHTYAEPGTYTVVLHVIACTSAIDCEHSFETRTDLIEVAAAALETRFPSDAVRAGSRPSAGDDPLPDPAGDGVGLAGAMPIEELSASSAFLSAPFAIPAGPAILELMAACTSDGSQHACSVTALEVTLAVGSRMFSMAPIDPAGGALIRADGSCRAIARYGLQLDGEAVHSADARIAIRSLSDSLAFELTVHHDGWTVEVLGGTLAVGARPLRR